jgi:2-methylisocitrate lyase-like PEP mutase family enzyme
LNAHEEFPMRPQAAAMQALLNEPALQVMPGCADGMGARLIEEAGFKIGFASGFSISAMRLAMPDMDLLTFPEMLDAVGAIITAAPKVLWLADGDTGYGNAISVQKTIRAYARAGAAAVQIEDKVWPHPLGDGGAKRVIERQEARLRCRAAVEACREEGVLLLARTDACMSHGFEEALARIQDFVAEGADFFYLPGLQSEAEMRAYVEGCKGKPAVAMTTLGGTHFMPGDDDLARIGIRVAGYPQDILAATVHAARAALAGLKGGPKPPMTTPAELAAAIRLAEYVALDERLSGDGSRAMKVGPATPRAS